MKSIASPILIQQITEAISTHYEPSEARAIAFRCLDLGWNLSSMDIILKKEVDLPADWDLRLGRLSAGEPLQYVMGKTYFRDHLFQVNTDTLIPRPETEELVDLVLRHAPENASVLDVGTGSGCIPISLKLERPSLTVEAWDISAGALEMARQNANALKAEVDFKQQDIFAWPSSEGTWEVIVSNPPYVTEEEKKEMANHVLDFEPNLALFVPNDDALKYYEALADFALERLHTGGYLCLEINQYFGTQTVELLFSKGFQDVKLIKDFKGNDRMIVAQKSGL
ncbi:peptide chain release factor N(5)-glutamine methyltransferase [Aquirufa lenticrescens]|uniref:peptide chain release factor N(5)-glutamine methyltransferase n=1 Tax=Aquirufa lenticrescens TaxID=2696560 RepID=UPI001CAA4C7B|nr:peptide chain release factor N(5)-glutamine methyltransferase [Aquirufa lenticrescens]UAJ13432.1 peptide chain release factor N(5)-glutamine methyltransferase [Aquirufa lenticrescens]